MVARTIAFEAENINLLNKLFYNRHGLRLSNFGRNSLKEIETFLSSMNLALGMFLNEIEILSAFDENNEVLLYKGLDDEKNYSDGPKSIIKNFEYFLNKLDDDRSIDILKKRSGLFLNKSFTLEEIAKQYSMTRERVRQIEKKQLINFRRYF